MYLCTGKHFTGNRDLIYERGIFSQIQISIKKDPQCHKPEAEEGSI